MSHEDKKIANHLFNRVRIYQGLIDIAAAAGDFAEEERLEAVQGQIREQLRGIIFRK